MMGFHPKYAAWAEVSGDIRQYNPSQPDVAKFLHRWIEEDLDLFQGSRIFHLGADEAWRTRSLRDAYDLEPQDLVRFGPHLYPGGGTEPGTVPETFSRRTTLPDRFSCANCNKWFAL